MTTVLWVLLAILASPVIVLIGVIVLDAVLSGLVFLLDKLFRS